MTISALCNRVVVTIQRQASAEDAARLMRSSHIGDVIVVDAADTRVPVGILEITLPKVEEAKKRDIKIQ